MALSNEDSFRFANEAGTEAFQLIVRQAGTLGEQSFNDILTTVTGAAAVCLANALRPALEKASPDARAE